MPSDARIGELDVDELRALVPQLQSLTEKYKRSERVQKALYEISELSSSVECFDSLYPEIHKIIASFMHADNFFIAFHEANEGKIQFAYFVDERDEEVLQTISYEKIKSGITAHILRSGENIVLNKENLAELAATHNFKILGTPPVDLIGVPVIRHNKVIGAMVVQSYTQSVRYNTHDLEMLVFMSQHIVTAQERVMQRDLTESLIEERTALLVKANTTLEAEIAERARMETLQKALYQISELSTKVDGNIIDFYSKLHKILEQLISAQNCYVGILDDDREYLHFPYFVGRDEDYQSSRKLTHGLSEYVIRSNEALLVDSQIIHQLVDSKEVEPKFVSRMLETGNSWMGAPLEVDNVVKGIIAVQTYGEGDDYEEGDLDVLRFVSRHISVAIQRREAANELIKYNQQLSEKVLERTKELNKSNQSLKKQIEQRKEVELKLIHDAHHDSLTDLPNRVMFNSRLELAIASKARFRQHKYALLFIDLDRFKTINDTLGHQAGDDFLIEASRRISACKRDHDLVARLGGDEFVVLVDNFNTMYDVESIAQRIVDSISASFIIEEKEVFSGASVGIAEITSEHAQADDVLRDADAAMYQAKNLGRNRYVLFDMSMRNQIIQEIDHEREFRKAFIAGEFEYSLQAIKQLDDHSVLFYQCDVTWPKYKKSKTQDNFWQLADKCGLTYAVNKQLLDESFRILHTWNLDPEFKDAKIGISLSVEHLLHNASFDDLVQKIEANDAFSDRLVIELSEQALTRFNKYLPTMLQKLQMLGVTLILDNFGSQSGSLNHLFKYDFDYIKLNESLVNSFGMSDKYHRLTRSIVLIANEMGIGVIAEGVNDDMILQDVIEVGCHFGKGLQLAKH